MVLPDFIRPALVVLVTAAVAGIVITVSRSGPGISAPVQSAFQKLPSNIDIALKQVRFSDMKNGSADWVLVSDTVQYDKSGDVAHLTGGIRMDFVRSGARGAIRITADSGDYRGSGRDINLRGHVKVLTDDGASFETESIDYAGAAYQFRTTEKVVCRQARLSLVATGMVMDLKSNQVSFSEQVDATVTGTSGLAAPAAPASKPKAVSPAKKKPKIKTKKRTRKKR